MGEPAMDAAAVLIVSDRADLPLLLRGPCAARGLRLAWEPDADRGLGPAAAAYRLVLLDAAMAGVDAPEAVRAFRGHSTLPLVVISLLTRAADPIATLESGADDYVGGPLDPEEVVARVRAVLRRQRVDRVATARGVAEAGGVRLECAARQARVEGASVDSDGRRVRSPRAPRPPRRPQGAARRPDPRRVGPPGVAARPVARRPHQPAAAQDRAPAPGSSPSAASATCSQSRPGGTARGGAAGSLSGAGRRRPAGSVDRVVLPTTPESFTNHSGVRAS